MGIRAAGRWWCVIQIRCTAAATAMRLDINCAPTGFFSIFFVHLFRCLVAAASDLLFCCFFFSRCHRFGPMFVALQCANAQTCRDRLHIITKAELATKDTYVERVRAKLSTLRFSVAVRRRVWELWQHRYIQTEIELKAEKNELPTLGLDATPESGSVVNWQCRRER